MPTTYGADGRACVIAGQPVVLELELLDATGAAQDYTGRSFAQRVFTGAGEVVIDVAGSSPVIEDGHSVIRFVMTGGDTGGVSLGPDRAAKLRHEVGEVLVDGFSPILLNAFTVIGAGDVETALPVGPGSGDPDGPITRYTITDASPNRLTVQYLGSPGRAAEAQAYADAAVAIEAAARAAEDAAIIALSGAPNGFASLNGSGIIPTNQLPPISAVGVTVVASQAAMLALTVVAPWLAVRTDLSGASFILASNPASTLANWVAISTSAAVSSVQGQTGAVSLTAPDVGGATIALDNVMMRDQVTGDLCSLSVAGGALVTTIV